MLLLVGLGNPGPNNINNRHNIGFKIIDAKLRTNEEHFSPGFQSGPMHYFFNQMPTVFNVADLIASWSKA